MGIATNSSVVVCFKEFETFVLCKYVSQSEPTCIVYSESIENEHVKIIFHNGNIQNVKIERIE